MFDLKSWDGFTELPREGLDYLLDTTAINRKLADKKESPYRWRVGSFQIPKDATGLIRERMVKDACSKFVGVMEQQDWELASKLQVFQGLPYAYDIDDCAVLLDKEELRVRGVFRTNPKPIRIELPPSSVRQDREQVSSLAEVMKGEGIAPVSQNKRR